MFTLTFIRKSKRHSMMQQIFCRTTHADGRETESLCSATKTFSHTIKQLLYQYNKILTLCNIKRELARSFSLNLILVSGNWAHALDPVLPEDQMTQTKTSTFPNRCYLIKIKYARRLNRKITGPSPTHLSTQYPL